MVYYEYQAKYQIVFSLNLYKNVQFIFENIYKRVFRMGRPPLVTKEVKKALTELVISKSGKYKKTSIDHVFNYLKSLEKRGEITKSLSKSSIYKALAEIRKKYQKTSKDPNNIDLPWSLGSLTKHYIPYDSIGPLLKIRDGLLSIHLYLTIREAIWMARLLRVPREKEINFDSTEEVEDFSFRLWRIVLNYAYQEIICELNGLPCDTVKFDDSTLEKIEYKIDTLFNEFIPDSELKVFIAERSLEYNRRQSKA
jgi:hypothetical protein